MKIGCIFPIFKNINVKSFFDKFLKSSFFSEHKDLTIITYIEESNTKELSNLKLLAQNNPCFQVFTTNTSFSYNDAFFNFLKSKTSFDLLLLGDVNIPNIDLIFNKCLEKHNLGANIVFVQKKKKGFKNFISKTNKTLYNFFVKLYTSNEDECNISSLGLIDKDLLDVLKELPNKSCFLKNTNSFKGFKSKTIYIEDNIKTYKENFKVMTPALITTIIFSCIFLATLITLILGNIFFSNNKDLLNIITILILLICLIIICLIFPKHFFDIRNTSLLREKLIVKNIKGE